MAYAPTFILQASLAGPLVGASGLATLTPYFDPTGILGDGATSFDLPTGMYLAAILAVGDAAAAGTLSLTLENSSDTGQSVGWSGAVTEAGALVCGVIGGLLPTQFFPMGSGNRTVDLAFTNDTGQDMPLQSGLLSLVRIA